MYLILDRERAVEFIEFTEHIVCHYPTENIHIILDNFSVHKAPRVQAWLASHPRVKLYFLPCYMPQISPIQKVWQHMKAYVTAKRL